MGLYCIKDPGWGLLGWKVTWLWKSESVNFSFFIWNIFLSIRVSAESTFQECSHDKKFTGSSSGKWSGFCINACWAFRGRYYKWYTFFHFHSWRGKKSSMFLPQILIYSVINLKWKLISLLTLTSTLEQRGHFDFLTDVLIYSQGH